MVRKPGLYTDPDVEDTQCVGVSVNRGEREQLQLEGEEQLATRKQPYDA